MSITTKLGGSRSFRYHNGTIQYEDLSGEWTDATIMNTYNRLTNLESEMQTLKDATLNNMTNNVFVETFDSLNSIRLSSGIYDGAARKIYI